MLEIRSKQASLLQTALVYNGKYKNQGFIQEFLLGWVGVEMCSVLLLLCLCLPFPFLYIFLEVGGGGGGGGGGIKHCSIYNSGGLSGT